MVDNNDIRPQLQKAQRQNLRTMEQWAKQQGLISGVPVVQALTYELIQYANQAYLGHLLAERQESNG